MSTFRRFFLSFVFFLLGASAAFAATPVERNGLLKINDNGKLSDSSGNPVQLRGMSLFWSVWGAAWWNESAVDQAVDYLGCEILRAPMAVGSKEDSGNIPKDVEGGYLTNPAANVAWVRTVVDQATARGIYVIIDWHDHAAETHKDAAIGFFTEMAREYGNRPNVLFEIYNEPMTDWPTIKTYAQDVIAAIRSTDGVDGQKTQNVIIVGTPGFSQLGQPVIDSRIADPNVAYALHFYAASHFLSAGVGQNAKDAVAANLPVIVTEWGTVTYGGTGAADKAHSQEWVDWMSQNNITWLNWSLYDKNEGASMFKTGTTFLGPWSTDQMTSSGKMVKDWLPAPTTEFSVSPSLIRFFYWGGEGATTVTKGTLASATNEQPWLHVSVSDQTITVAADSNDTADNRTDSVQLTDDAGRTAKAKVLQRFDDGNLAMGKPTTASSQEDAYRAELATDGDDTSTRWGSEFSDPQWIMVDLGQDYPVAKVVLMWEAGYSSHYKIQLAPAGSDPTQDSSYATIYDSGVITDTKLGAHTDVLTDKLAPNSHGQYIRMYSLGRITPWGNSLWEFKVYSNNYINVIMAFPLWASGVTGAVVVDSNVNWAAVSDSDWLTIKPSTGHPAANPEVTITANTTGSTRTGVLTFTGGGVTQNVNVAQETEKLTLGTSAWSSPSGNADSTTVKVNANTPWQTASSDASWLTVTPRYGFFYGTMTISVAPNTGAESRTGTVTVTSADSTISQTVTVSQGVLPQPPTVTVEPPAVLMGPSASSVSVRLTSNASWTAASNSAWLTVSPASGGNGVQDVTLTVTANSDASRQGTVTFDCAGCASKATVAVTQIAQPPTSALSVSPTTWTAPASGGSQTITITSNVTWSATSNATWLTVSGSASDSGNGSITLNANTNGEGASRTGTVAITGGGLTAKVDVTQAAATGRVLQAVPATMTVDAVGGTYTITVNSNTDWWYWSEVDWLTFPASDKRGKGNGTFSFTVSANNTGVERSTTIKLQAQRANGQNFNSDITITQPAAQQNQWTPPAGGGTALRQITRTGSWTATSSAPSWLTVSPASGSGNASITLGASANSGAARQATVTVAGGGDTKTIQVNQASATLPPAYCTPNFTVAPLPNTQTGNFNRTTEVCFMVQSAKPLDFNCSEMSARTVTVNGTPYQSSACSSKDGKKVKLATASDGKYYFDVSAGTPSWSSIAFWNEN